MKHFMQILTYEMKHFLINSNIFHATFTVELQQLIPTFTLRIQHLKIIINKFNIYKY